MKKFIYTFGTLALLLSGAGCDKPQQLRTEPIQEPEPEPEPTTTHVSLTYRIANQIESDIVIELSFEEKRVITIKPGETQTIDSETSIVDGYPIAPIKTEKIFEFCDPKMKIDGEIVLDLIWNHRYWRYDEERPGNALDMTYTLTVTDERIEMIVNDSRSLPAIEVGYRIANRTGYDMVVALNFGDKQTTTIEPGEEQVVYSDEFHIDEDRRVYDKEGHLITEVLYLEVSPVLEAEMRIGGEVVSGEIWDVLYWESEHEKPSGGTPYHICFSLAVTDELLEAIQNH